MHYKNELRRTRERIITAEVRKVERREAHDHDEHHARVSTEHHRDMRVDVR